jgi:hypothetical protein
MRCTEVADRPFPSGEFFGRDIGDRGRSPLRIPITDGVEIVSKDSELHSLHRYFIWANRMKNHCAEAIHQQGDPPSGGVELRIWFSAPFSYACYWFATLYVVVEGMQELQLTNPPLSTLLKDDDKLQKLRRFRNGVYHYQTDYFDNRIRDFLSAPYMDWASELHGQLSQFFHDWFESRGMGAQVLENSEDRIRIMLKNPTGDDIEILLDATDSKEQD